MNLIMDVAKLTNEIYNLSIIDFNSLKNEKCGSLYL